MAIGGTNHFRYWHLADIRFGMSFGCKVDIEVERFYFSLRPKADVPGPASWHIEPPHSTPQPEITASVFYTAISRAPCPDDSSSWGMCAANVAA
jgi:hypothetical protein